MPGYPKRTVPRDEGAAKVLKCTLTDLYNAQPQWVADAHAALDAAAAAAYGLLDGHLRRRGLARVGGGQPWAGNGQANRAA